MPFLKFSRDKRGYEHFCIVEPSAPRRGKSSRPRVLFWFRTPPQVKVGREPFTDDVRRAIEAQNPGLKFDWVRLMATPIPAADAEHWRERRRAEKAARLSSREAAVESDDQDGQAGQALHEHDTEQAAGTPDPHTADHAGAEFEPHEQHEQHELHELHGGDATGDEIEGELEEDVVAEPIAAASASESAGLEAVPASGVVAPSSGRRRRRRGRRRRPQTVESPAGTAAPASESSAPNVRVPPTDEV